MRIVWTAPAYRDLIHAFDYVAEDNGAAAGRLIETILAATESLASFPFLGRVGQLPNTRELVITGTPYYVPYRIKGSEIQILSVIHGARKWPD
jgi:toxin ParE1/3/4